MPATTSLIYYLWFSTRATFSFPRGSYASDFLFSNSAIDIVGQRPRSKSYQAVVSVLHFYHFAFIPYHETVQRFNVFKFVVKTNS